MTNLKKKIDESYPENGNVIIIFEDGTCLTAKESEVLDFIESEGLNLDLEQGELVGYYQDTTGPEYAPEVIVIDAHQFLDDNWDMVMEKFAAIKEVAHV